MRAKKLFPSRIFIILLILLVGLFLRLYLITSAPSGFFCDEASIGYNAYTLLHTGKDEYGEAFPIFFKSFGDYRHPIAVYSTIPLVAILGLSEYAVRIQGLLYGMILIMLIYLLSKEGINKKTGIYAALAASLMPWLIHYNRTGFEFSCYATFFTLSIYLLIKSSKNKKIIIPFFISTAITFYTYQPAKLLMPLLLLGGIIIYRKMFFKHFFESIIGGICFLIISSPLIYSFFSGEATARFNQVSILNSHLPLPGLLLKILGNYFIQLSPTYLFITGENTFITRHFTHGLLPLLAITFPFLIIGFVTTLYHIKKPIYQLLLLWLLLYPIAGAVVADPPFTSRAIIGAPLFAILIGIGIDKFLKATKTLRAYPIIIISIALLFVINTVSFFNFYINSYPLYSSDFWGWQYGAKDIVAYFDKSQYSYDQEIMAPEFNAPEVFFRFYAPIDCQHCLVGLPDTTYDPAKKQLFALTPDYLHSHPQYKFKTLNTLYYPNRTIAFQIGEIVQ